MTEATAILACTVLLGLTGFQLLLINGQPLGHYAWGGNHKVLPPKLKIGSAISIVLYLIFAAIILDYAGLMRITNNDTVTRVGIWVLTAYFFIGIFMNIASRSKYERRTMTPVAFLLFMLCLIVALS